jgi:hypothetical protein
MSSLVDRQGKGTRVSEVMDAPHGGIMSDDRRGVGFGSSMYSSTWDRRSGGDFLKTRIER